MKSIQSIFSSCILLSVVLSFSAMVFSAPSTSSSFKGGVAKTATPKIVVSKVAKPTIEKTVSKKPMVKVDAAQSVNINQADAEKISSVLKGIGLKKAQAIIEWRKANGKFTRVEQLLEIKGIGEKTLAANKAKISL